jgi:hypothetical protein
VYFSNYFFSFISFETNLFVSFDDTQVDQLITSDDIQRSQSMGGIRTTRKERQLAVENDLGPQSDDLKAFRRVSRKQQFQVQDSLERREADYRPTRVFRSVRLAQDHHDNTTQLSAYICASSTLFWKNAGRKGSPMVIGKPTDPKNNKEEKDKETAEQLSKGGLPVSLLLPNERGWKSKAIRVFADDLALHSRSVVVVPDIFRKKTDLIGNEYEKSLLAGTISIAERRQMNDDILAALRFTQEQLKPSSITLYGMGIGGGLALELACDLHAIRCFQEHWDLQSMMERASRGLPPFPSTVSRRNLQGKNSSFIFPSSNKTPFPWNFTEMASDKQIQSFLEEKMISRKLPVSVRKERRTLDLAMNGIYIDPKRNKILKGKQDGEAWTEDLSFPEMSETNDNDNEENGELKGNTTIPGTDIVIDEEKLEEETRRDIEEHFLGKKKGDQPEKKGPTVRLSPQEIRKRKRIQKARNFILKNPFYDIETEQLSLISELIHIRLQSQYAFDQKIVQNNSRLPVEVLSSYLPKSVIVFDPTHFNLSKVCRHLYSPLTVFQGLSDDQKGIR